jgi:tight adherence protein C
MGISNSQLPPVIAGGAFIILLLLCYSIIHWSRQKTYRRGMISKIRVSGDSVDSFSTDTHSDTGTPFFLRPFLSMFSFFGRKLGSAKPIDYTGTRLRFLKAGIRSENAPLTLWGAKCSFLILFVGIFLTIRLTILEIVSTQSTVAVLIFLSLAGFYLPDLWLSLRIKHRKTEILNSLPDALDLLVVCVEAGMGLDSAITRVSQEIRFNHSKLSDELILLNLELQAGMSRQDALKNFAARTDIMEIQSLVTLLVQSEKFGTSIASALRVFSDSYRTERYQRAEEIAAKLPVKLVIPLILFILPSLFVVLMGPAAISIYRNIFSQL